MSDMSSIASPVASLESENDEPSRNAQQRDTSDSEDEITTRKSRKHAAPVDEEDSDVPMGEDDLFGDGSASEGRQSPKRRKLSDTELDSGDDENRRDRIEEDLEEEEQEQTLRIIDYELDRHGIPLSGDGEFYLLRFPQSIGIDPVAFAPGTFKKPAMSHHGAPPSSAFSASQVANSTIRWRRDPNDPEKLQSNARVLRWSDGSLTLQIASTPFDQFELPAKALAPPRARPLKITPVSDPKKPGKFDSRLESHTYLTSVHPTHNLVQITNHITASLTVQTNEENDEALIRLQEQLSAATKGSKGEGGRGPEIVTLTEDPELARKRAEAAERDRTRADRRRQNQQEKERDRAARVMGRSAGRSGGTGLTIGGLEDDEGGADSRRRTNPSRKPRRRNSEYSEDEEEGYGRRGAKEDEYDKEDGFLVESDEEIEMEDDESEEEEFAEIDADGEEQDDERPAAKERNSAADEPSRGARRRRVVDDDDDDD